MSGSQEKGSNTIPQNQHELRQSEQKIISDLLLLSYMTKKWNKNHVLKYDWIEHRSGSVKLEEWKMYQKCMSVFYFSKMESLNNVTYQLSFHKLV